MASETTLFSGLPEDIRWLLAEANELLAGQVFRNELQQAARLRKQHGKERGRLLSELLELRGRGATKFTRSRKMFLTRKGLEQATDEQIARYKAQRFENHQSIVDLCSGVGGDALGLGTSISHAKLTIVDRDQQLCAYAAANLSAYDVAHERIRIECADVRDVALDDFESFHIDPDRRADGRRHAHIDTYEPPISQLRVLRGLPKSGAIKLAPSADASALLKQGAELEWVGHRRECQQLIAWLGDLARAPGQRVCTVLSKDSVCSARGQLIGAPETAPLERRYVYEPAPSVLAAGLAHQLAAHHGLERLATNVAYLTSDKCIATDLLARFKVVTALPFRKRELRRALASLDLELREVKSRMVPIEPTALLKELRGTGQSPAVLLLYPKRKSIRAVLAKRDENATSDLR